MVCEKEILIDFIECYKNHNALWDVTSKNYALKYKKENGYNELEVILKKLKPTATKEDVKRKINTLRSAYRKELKKVKRSESSGVGTDDVYTPSLWWFDYMNFLNTPEKPTKSISTTDLVEEEEEITSAQSFPKILLQMELNKQKKRDKLLSMASEYLSKNKNENIYKVEQVWGNKLKQFTPLQRLRIEKKINDIFYEEELQLLTASSPPITIASSLSTFPQSANRMSLPQPKLRSLPKTVSAESSIKIFSEDPLLICENNDRSTKKKQKLTEFFKNFRK